MLTQLYYQQANYEQTINLATQLLSSTTDYYLYYIRGISFYKTSKTTQALQDLTKAIKLDSTGDCGSGVKGEVYFILGKIYYETGELRKAVEFFEKTNVINPKYKEAYLNKAKINYELSYSTVALKELEKYLSFEETKEALLLKSEIEYDIGKYEEAISILKKLLSQDLEPQQKIYAADILSNCYINTGQYELAKEVLLDERYSSDDDGRLKLTLAKLYYYEDSIEAAQNQLENIFLIYSDNSNILAEAYLLKILIYKQLSQNYTIETMLPEIEEFFKNQMISSPKEYKNYYLLAAIYSEVGINPEETLKLAKRCIELKPNKSDSYYILAKAYLLANNTEKAVQTLKKSLELNPNHVWSLYYLGKIFEEKLLRPKDAEVYYQKLLKLNPNFRFLQK